MNVSFNLLGSSAAFEDTKVALAGSPPTCQSGQSSASRGRLLDRHGSIGRVSARNQGKRQKQKQPE